MSENDKLSTAHGVRLTVIIDAFILVGAHAAWLTNGI